MKVLVLGGYGLIGSEVLRALLDAGHDVTGLGRSVDAARRRLPAADWVRADLSDLVTPEAWAGVLSGFEAIVNCAGVLQDSSRDDIRKIQRDAMVALFAACETEGVTRFVQISAVGAAPDAPTLFMSTKGEADAALRSASLNWTILRPGLVLSPTAYGATGLLRALAAMPAVIPLAGADAPVQTVDVKDVASAVVACLAGDVASRCTYDLVEAEPHRLRDLVAAMRGWLGFAPAAVVSVPNWLARISFTIGDGLGQLGWRTPMRSTAFHELLAGIGGDPEPWRDAGGRSPAPLAETLARLPSSVQERWYARLWLARPLAIACLSAFWLVSGIIGLVMADTAAGILETRGVGTGLAWTTVLAGAAIDVALALTVLVRSTHRLALTGMIVVTAGYLLAGSHVAPDLWLDPLGVFVKSIPAAVLALVALAVAEER